MSCPIDPFSDHFNLIISENVFKIAQIPKVKYTMTKYCQLNIYWLISSAGDQDQPPVVPAAKASETTKADGFPPTFTEKPRIVPNETGTLVTMKFKVRAKPKAEMQWFKGSQKIKEGTLNLKCCWEWAKGPPNPLWGLEWRVRSEPTF